MDEKTKSFLSRLKWTYEMSQEATKELIDGNEMDPLNLKISARKEVVSDVLESLRVVELITDKEALEWAELFEVELSNARYVPNRIFRRLLDV